MVRRNIEYDYSTTRPDSVPIDRPSPRCPSRAHDQPGSTPRSLRAQRGPPVRRLLTETSILDALNEHGVHYRDRVFGPVTTIWGFLSQVLSDDHSCRDAVSRIIAHRAASGLEACSPNTRQLLQRPRPPPHRRPAHPGEGGPPRSYRPRPRREWKWNGRSVFIADGSHVSMPDTPENQAVYPQPVVQQPGIGFPLARVTVLLSLATGACHDLAIAPYAGKGTGETTLLRRMYDSLSPGDVVLADALFDNYFLACELRSLGVELVARVQAERVGSRTVESSARRRHHPLAAAQQAARDDGGAVSPLPEEPADAPGDRRCPRQGQPRRAVQGRHHDPRRVDRRRADRRPV